MKIIKYFAHELLEIDYDSKMTKSVANKFYSYVQSHMNFLEKIDPESSKRELNYVLVVEDNNGKVWGYRYFYWEKSMNRFHFFAVVMDEAIKRQGFAIKTFLEAVSIANKLGVKRFYSTINSKTSVERDGLVNAYKRICQELHKNGNLFEVEYLDKSFILR
jgi:L-amino acid N-acyltransferase YncA